MYSLSQKTEKYFDFSAGATAGRTCRVIVRRTIAQEHVMTPAGTYRPGQPSNRRVRTDERTDPVQDVTLPRPRSKLLTCTPTAKNLHPPFTGIFRNLRMLGGAALFLLYFGTVWLTWNGRQAVWWTCRNAISYLRATYWPQDFMLLSTADHRCLRFVLYHRIRRARLVAAPARRAYSPGFFVG